MSIECQEISILTDTKVYPDKFSMAVLFMLASTSSLTLPSIASMPPSTESVRTNKYGCLVIVLSAEWVASRDHG